MESSRDNKYDEYKDDFDEWVDRLREYSAKKRQFLEERGYLSEQEELDLINDFKV